MALPRNAPVVRPPTRSCQWCEAWILSSTASQKPTDMLDNTNRWASGPALDDRANEPRAPGLRVLPRHKVREFGMVRLALAWVGMEEHDQNTIPQEDYTRGMPTVPR